MRRFNLLLAALPVAALLLAMFAMPTFADPRDFTVTNNTSFIVTHVFAGSSDSDSWGDDILGNSVLSPSEAVGVTFPGFDGSQCLYDVKIVGQDGQTGVMYKVNLCYYSDVSFSDA
jgi:hypothetical protein